VTPQPKKPRKTWNGGSKGTKTANVGGRGGGTPGNLQIKNWQGTMTNTFLKEEKTDQNCFHHQTMNVFPRKEQPLVTQTEENRRGEPEETNGKNAGKPAKKKGGLPH